MSLSMFCRQCEQTVQQKGCSVRGVCGKSPEVANLQDELIYGLISLSIYICELGKLKVFNKEAERVLIEGLFTTVTNVNFDQSVITSIIDKVYQLKQKLEKDFYSAYEKTNKEKFTGQLPKFSQWVPKKISEIDINKGHRLQDAFGVEDEDNISLRELLLYGLKGMAAYADHALLLGKEDTQVSEFFSKGLASLADTSLSVDELISLLMEFGGVNLRCLELLDSAHTETFGNPIPTKVALGVKKGPAIVVSGHDLLDLSQLLAETENSGINIYTHGEMLPAHGYPELKKYKHLAGHFGTAWQNQRKEFDAIPAVVLMTTNCIQEPKVSYNDRIFTTGLVAWPGVEHITAENGKKDFSKLIQKAKDLKGFPTDAIKKEITVGFGHHTVLQLADKVVEAVKSKAIRHFFLIGGCDGAKPGRNYYTDFAQKVPDDCIILTLACGKFRFNDLDFGSIDGLPRLLDCGQCNDAYSAIKIASALADAFGVGINDLPLSLILSWYEQKAVCILITLLSLGVKNIKLGPSLPAFVSGGVLKVLVDKFNIAPSTTAQDDLNAILG